MLAGDEFYDDEVTSGPMPAAEGSGTPPTITAVGAPSGEPFDGQIEAMLLFIDRMDGRTLRRFLVRLNERYPISAWR